MRSIRRLHHPTELHSKQSIGGITSSTRIRSPFSINATTKSLFHQRRHSVQVRYFTKASSTPPSQIFQRSKFCLSVPTDDFVAFLKSFSQLEPGETENIDQPTQILCCSPATTTDIPIQNQNLLSKLVYQPVLSLLQTIRRWAQTTRYAILVFLRGMEIGVHLSPMMLLGPLALLESQLKQASSSHQMEDLAWRYFLYSLQNLGPAFVKLAQWAATRRDLFPPYLCDHLSPLHDQAFVHPWKHTHEILAQAFGPDYSSELEIDSSSSVIGSGSAAQVYHAHLRGYGPVAVKVLHPKIHERVERDLLLMEHAAQFIDAILPSDVGICLSLPRATENFSSILRNQLDLRVEGQNLTKFNDNFSRTRAATNKVSFPRPVLDWTSRDVLVESIFIDSKPISSYIRDTSEEGLRTRYDLALPLLRAFLQMVFLDNFIHCDLHPGNVMVQEQQQQSSATTKHQNHTIIFLDAGIATSLSSNDQKNLRDLFKAVVLNDGRHVGRLMVERAKYEKCSQIPGGVESFATGMEEIVSEFHDQRSLSLGAMRIGSLLKRVLDLCRVHGVEIDPAMANVVVSTLVLEGLGRSLDPDVNLMNCALPFILGKETGRVLS